MKYCEKCGKELLDEAVICPGCGNVIKKIKISAPKVGDGSTTKKSKLKTFMSISGVWMSVSCVLNFLYWVYVLIGNFIYASLGGVLLAVVSICANVLSAVFLINYFCKTKKQVPLGKGFKICTLVFSILSMNRGGIVFGILMLCDKEVEQY